MPCSPLTSTERRVQLVRPFPAHAWPRVWSWLEPFRRRVLDDLDPQTRDEYVAQQLALETRPEYRSWGVEWEGELGGLIALLQPRGPHDPSAIAHLLFRQELFRLAVVAPAVREAFGQAFRDGIASIRGELFEDNNGIRNLVRALGAREYGIIGRNKQHRFVARPIPGAARRRGQLVGMIGFVITPEDLRNETSLASREATSGPSLAAAADVREPAERSRPGLPGPPEEAA